MVVVATITLTGVAQNVAAGFAAPGATTVSVPQTDLALKDAACRQILLQADSANTHIIAVGADNTVTTSTFGFAVPAPVTAVFIAPIVLGAYDQGGIRLSDLWVIGTANEKLHVFANVI